MSASPEQLHELLQYCTGFARAMLENAGDFYPFGATITREGKVAAIGGYNGEERPNPLEIYTLLVGGFSAGAKDGSILGAALAANVNIPQQFEADFRDGLRVQLESSGYSRFVYLPYKLTANTDDGRKFLAEFAQPFSVEVAPAFFPAVSGRK